MNADLCAAKAAEEAFGLIGIGAVCGLVFHLMVDALYWEVGRELVPMRSFIGVDGRTCGNDLLGEGDASGFRLLNSRKRAAITFASYNDDLALAGLIFSKAAILAIFLAVLGRTWPPK